MAIYFFVILRAMVKMVKEFFRSIIRSARFFSLVIVFVLLLLPFMLFSLFGRASKKIQKALGIKKDIDDKLFQEKNWAVNDVWAEFFSTPYLYVWNGREYVLENDIMQAEPDVNYHPEVERAKENYEAGACSPDLYRIQQPVGLDAGAKIRLRIKEEDPEESFIDEVRVFGVRHSADSEILVGSDYQNIYEIEKEKAKNAVLPSEVCVKGRASIKVGSDIKDGLRLGAGETAEFTFSDLESGKKYALLLEVKERGWSPQAKTVFTSLPGLKLFLLFGGALVAKLTGSNWLWNLPLFMLAGGSKCIHFYYRRKEQEAWSRFGGCHPREKSSWEVAEVPDEAIIGGRLNLQFRWTRTHTLSFIGLVMLEDSMLKSPSGELKMVFAIDQGGKDVAALVAKRDHQYLHTIQGDTVDLVFRDENVLRGGDAEKTTYLISASGFYTALRLQNNRKLLLSNLFRQTARSG